MSGPVFGKPVRVRMELEDSRGHRVGLDLKNVHAVAINFHTPYGGSAPYQTSVTLEGYADDSGLIPIGGPIERQEYVIGEGQ
jgi:hypothetical protein